MRQVCYIGRISTCTGRLPPPDAVPACDGGVEDLLLLPALERNAHEVGFRTWGACEAASTSLPRGHPFALLRVRKQRTSFAAFQVRANLHDQRFHITPLFPGEEGQACRQMVERLRVPKPL